MTTLLSILLINAVVVVPLAAGVWCVSRFARRPALTHILWVLVLFKLVTPPFFRLPFSITIPAAGNVVRESTDSAVVLSPEVARELTAVSTPKELVNLGSVIRSEQQDPLSRPGSDSEPALGIFVSGIGEAQHAGTAARVGHWVGNATSQIAAVASWLVSQPILRGVALSIWILGSLVWFSHQAIRGLRFWRGIQQNSASDPRLQQQARRLAIRLGLKRCPQVVVVDAQLSPMLWGYGSNLRLLFPLDLAKRLNHDARATLLAHELAHYSRGDHWIRVLELLVTGAFWWHPVVWVARNRIEESEEECCDAWVVSELPHAPRRYAEALLDTIDFLCDRPVAVPPLASGLGTAAFLRRRLTRIMQGAPSKDLSARQRGGVLLIALLALPMQPFVLGASVPPRPTWEPVALATHMPTALAPVTSAAAPTVTRPEPAGAVVVEQEMSTRSAAVPSRPERSPIRNTRSARGERIWGTAVSSDGRYAIHNTTGRRALLTNLATNQESELSAKGLTCVAFFANGDSFVAGSSDGQVTLWSSATASLTQTIYMHDDVVRSVAVSPRGDMIAIGGRDGVVRLIDPAKEHSLIELSRYESAVNCVRFAPDGRRLAAAVGDWNSVEPGQVVIWDLTSGRPDGFLHCESAPGAVSFASNDELIVGQWNGQISLWNLVHRQVVGSAMADKNIVTASSFSPDNPALREVPFFATNHPNAMVTREVGSP